MAGSATTDAYDNEPGDGDDGGSRGGGMLGGMFGGDAGSSRKLILIIVAAVVAILLLILLINVLNGGGNDDEPTPSPTRQSVLEPDSGTETGDSSSTPGAKPTREPKPTDEPTEEIRRGGDNQAEPNGNAGDEPSTPDGSSSREDQQALDDAPEGPVAASCADACLVRVSTDGDFVEVMRVAQVRPSFQGEGYAWVIAPRQSVAYIESQTAAALVADRGDSLNLYVVTLAAGQQDESPIGKFGKIVDRQGRVRLVEAASAPARVSSVTDAGGDVQKLPPAMIASQAPRETRSLASVEVGELGAQVSSENIQATISEMQGTSSNDGTNIGTRYYSQPGNPMAAEYLFQRLEAYGLTVTYQDFLTPEGFLLSNVIGEMAGADTTAIYGVMAHFDSTSVQIGAAPGADDNATDVAASLEIARVLGGYTLAHPVRIVFINAEEVGIIGSDVFARRAVAADEPYEGVFNIDSIGSDRQGNRILLNSDANSAWMSSLIVQINDDYGYGEQVLVYQEEGIVADDNKLRAQGIESVMVARELYGQSPVHHTPQDVIENVSIGNAASCTQIILISIGALVQT